MLYRLADRTPEIDALAWLAPAASRTVPITSADGASVWFGCVLRGDNAPIAVM